MAERPPSRDPFELCGSTITEKYRITELVGSGGFGVVYRGVHTGFGEPIAVKCLKIPDDLPIEERDRLLTRLQDEGRVLHRLSKLTSGIVQALDVGAMTTSRGQWVPYLVLEWLEGESLSEYLRARLERGEPAMSIDEAAELLEPAARALGIAHRHKVAHRDVKPDNLYLTEVGGQRTLKVLDFGIAKVLTHTSFTAAPNATLVQPTAFTPSYGAPEQFNKKRGATGPWTDVFALCLIVVELVTGQRALDGDDPTQLYIAAADPAARPTPRLRGVDTTDAVEVVLRRALAVDPQDRFSDADAFWDALREALGKKIDGRERTDVSETGEYVTRHAMDLEIGPEGGDDHDQKRTKVAGKRKGEPTDAKDNATERSVGAPVAKAHSRDLAVQVLEADDDGAPTHKFGGAPKASPRAPADRDGHGHTLRAADVPADADRATGSRAAEAPRRNPKAPADRPGSSPPRTTAGRAGSLPKAGRDETVEPPSEGAPSSDGRGGFRVPWTFLIVLAALAGAVLLYLELEGGRGPAVGAGTASAHRTSAVTTSPAPVTTRTSSAVRTTSVEPPDAARPGADADASLPDAGPDAATAPPAPPGMVYVPPAELDAGSEAHGFFIDKTEVTVSDFRTCVQAGRCAPARSVMLLEPTASLDQAVVAFAQNWIEVCNENRGAVDHPVNCVKHAEARDYCRFRSKRLPTAGEWRLAAGGPTARVYPWGAEPPGCDQACFGLNDQALCLPKGANPTSCAVGSKHDESPFGALDMAGNVSEWVADEGPDEGDGGLPRRMVLGGSFVDGEDAMKTSFAKSVPAVTQFPHIGFRCAKTAP